jgi:glycosyltransferase involved in cell wall biosynthesis
MFDGKSIAVVIPAYNEELLIGRVLSTMPAFVDHLIVINDCSRDRTREIVEEFQTRDPRIVLINHEPNKGLGQSLIDGYLESRRLGSAITAVMAGDAQMNPDDLPALVEPVASGQADYAKGNRLLRQEVYSRMPKHRLFGNAGLSLLTKFATGYWHLIDPQCGYTAIGKKALAHIPIERMTKGYGYNADILNMLNFGNFRVRDVEVEPVYGEERSKIKLRSYIPKVSVLLVRLFIGRMVGKYLVRDFNPLVLFYAFSALNLGLLAPILFVRLLFFYCRLGVVPTTTLTLLNFAVMMGFLFFFFAMWLDMEDNRRLRG